MDKVLEGQITSTQSSRLISFPLRPNTPFSLLILLRIIIQKKYTIQIQISHFHKHHPLYIHYLTRCSKYNISYSMTTNNKTNTAIVDSFFTSINRNNRNNNQPHQPTPTNTPQIIQPTTTLETTPNKIVRSNRTTANPRVNQQSQQQGSSILLGNRNVAIKAQIQSGKVQSSEEYTAKIDSKQLGLVSNSFLKSTTKIIKTVDNPFSFIFSEKDALKQLQEGSPVARQRERLMRNNDKSSGSSSIRTNNLLLTSVAQNSGEHSERNSGESNKKIQRRPAANTREIKFNTKKQQKQQNSGSPFESKQEESRFEPSLSTFEPRQTETKKYPYQRTTDAKPRVQTRPLIKEEQRVVNNSSITTSLIKDNPSTIHSSKASLIKQNTQPVQQPTPPIQSYITQNPSNPRRPYPNINQNISSKPSIQLNQSNIKTTSQAVETPPPPNVTPLITPYKAKLAKYNPTQAATTQSPKLPIPTSGTPINESDSKKQEQKTWTNPVKNIYGNRYNKNTPAQSSIHQNTIEQPKNAAQNSQTANQGNFNTKIGKAPTKTESKANMNSVNNGSQATSRMKAEGDEGIVEKKVKQNPKSKAEMRQSLTHFLNNLKKSIRLKVKGGFSRLKQNVKYCKVRQIEGSMLVVESIKIQRVKEGNLKLYCFELMKKIFGQRYINQLKGQLNYNPSSHKQLLISLLDKLYLCKVRQLITTINQRYQHSRTKIAYFAPLQRAINRRSLLMKRWAFSKIKEESKFRHHYILHFTIIADKCNREKLETAFIKMQTQKPTSQAVEAISKTEVVQKGRNNVKVEQMVHPIQDVISLHALIATLNTAIRQTQQKSKLKKNQQQKERKGYQQKLTILKYQHEQLNNDLSIKKERNHDLLAKISLIKTVGNAQPKDQRQSKPDRLTILANIYIENFKNPEQLVSAQQIVENYQLRIEDSNTLVGQWEAIWLNRQVRREIGSYQKLGGFQFRARVGLLQEGKLIGKLIGSYTKEQYFWNWIHQYAQQS